MVTALLFGVFDNFEEVVEMFISYYTFLGHAAIEVLAGSLVCGGIAVAHGMVEWMRISGVEEGMGRI